MSKFIKVVQFINTGDNSYKSDAILRLDRISSITNSLWDYYTKKGSCEFYRKIQCGIETVLVDKETAEKIWDMLNE